MIAPSRLGNRDDLAQGREGAEGEQKHRPGHAEDQRDTHQHDHDPPGADTVVQVRDHDVGAVGRVDPLQNLPYGGGEDHEDRKCQQQHGQICGRLGHALPLVDGSGKCGEAAGSPCEEGILALAVPDMQRRAEGDGDDQRHGNDFALGHDAVQVLDPDRHQIHLRPHPREVVEAALEGQQPLGAGVALAFGKQDQRCPLVERLGHLGDGVFGAFLGDAIDEDSVEHVAPDERTERRCQPVVAGGDRPGVLAQRTGQDRPDQHEIAVAGVVGKVDALAVIGGGPDPDATGCGNEPGKHNDRRCHDVGDDPRHAWSDPGKVWRHVSRCTGDIATGL